jgi:hypothetical protein
LKALVVVLASTLIVSTFEGVGPTPAPLTSTALGKIEIAVELTLTSIVSSGFGR